MRIFKIFIFISCWLAFAACSHSENDIVIEPEKEVEEEAIGELKLNAAESRAVEQVNSFNLDFFRTLVAQNPDESNVVCSPLSAAILLSMMANSTEGDLTTEISKVLGCADVEALNSLCKKYIDALPVVDPKVTVNAANSVWYDRAYTLNPKFKDSIEKSFKAENYACDFAANPLGAVRDINNWVSENTNGMIDNIVSDISNDVRSVFVNALYFYGAWANPFDEQETRDMVFYGANNENTVKMMYHKGIQSVHTQDDCCIVGMQVADGAYEALFIMPKKKSIDEFIATTDFDKHLSTTLLGETIEFYLPRFKFDPEIGLDLNKTLAEMGVKSLEKPSTLSMFKENVQGYNKVFQKVGVEFNEKGAEGSTATFTIWAHSGRFVPIYDYQYDHPFVFIIRETTTGAMLFAGKISEL